MVKIMVSFEVAGVAPTVEELKERFGLNDEEIDASFGVVEIDPETHTYTILVDAAAAEKVRAGGSISKVEGPFSNPRIEPFGPPEDDEQSTQRSVGQPAQDPDCRPDDQTSPG